MPVNVAPTLAKVFAACEPTVSLPRLNMLVFAVIYGACMLPVNVCPLMAALVAIAALAAVTLALTVVLLLVNVPMLASYWQYVH